jgi:hypothetical protein
MCSIATTLSNGSPPWKRETVKGMDTMPELQLPPVARLLLEIAALRLQNKMFEREIQELHERLSKVEASRAE